MRACINQVFFSLVLALRGIKRSGTTLSLGVTLGDSILSKLFRFV